jgi:hypothetical protein
MHVNHFKKGRSARATTKTGGSAALKKAAYSCARQTVTPAGRPAVGDDLAEAGEEYRQFRHS